MSSAHVRRRELWPIVLSEDPPSSYHSLLQAHRDQLGRAHNAVVQATCRDPSLEAAVDSLHQNSIYHRLARHHPSAHQDACVANDKNLPS